MTRVPPSALHNFFFSHFIFWPFSFFLRKKWSWWMNPLMRKLKETKQNKKHNSTFSAHVETQRSFFLPNSGHARRSDKNKFTSRLSFAHSAACFFFFFFFLNMLNDGWLVLDLDLEMYKKINWLNQLEWISLNLRSPHFLRNRLQFTFSVIFSLTEKKLFIFQKNFSSTYF